MKHGFMIGMVVLAFAAGPALAQMSSSESVTTTTPSSPCGAMPGPVVTLPPGTLSTTESQQSVDINGSKCKSTTTTYGNDNGAASDTTSTMTVQPPVTTTTTNKSSTTTSTSH